MPNEAPTWDETEPVAPTWDDTAPISPISTAKPNLTLAQMSRLASVPTSPVNEPPWQRDARNYRPEKQLPSLSGFGGTLKDVGGRTAGSAGDIMSLEALRPHIDVGEMKGIPPWLQAAERVSEAAGQVAAPVLTGAGVVGPILGEIGAAGQAASRLAIPAAGAANLRNLGKATGAVAGTPPSQRQPGEMAAAVLGDAGSAIVDTLAVLSAPTGSASEKIQAAKARMESALKPKVEPDIETMKRATPATTTPAPQPLTAETVPKPPDIPPQVIEAVNKASILPTAQKAAAEALAKPKGPVVIPLDEFTEPPEGTPIPKFEETKPVEADKQQPDLTVHTPKEPLSSEDVNTKAPEAYRSIPQADLSDPVKLGRTLTEDAASSRQTVRNKQGIKLNAPGAARANSVNASQTKRITLLQNPEGHVVAASTYRDPGTGNAMVAHPDIPAGRERVSKPLSKVMADGWKPVGSVLLNKAVKGHRQSFSSLAEAQKAFGFPETTQKSQEIPQVGFEGGKPVTITQPSQPATIGPTPEQAGIVHDHFSKYPSLSAAIDAISKSPRVVAIRDALTVAMDEIHETDPSLSETAAMEQALRKIYENAKNLDRKAYVQQAEQREHEAAAGGHEEAEPGVGEEVGGEDEAQGDISIGPGAAAPSDVGVDQEALKPSNATFQRIQRATTNYYRGIKQLFARSAVKVDLPKLANAADNIPRMAGQAAGNSIRLRGNLQEQQAATFVMQSFKMSGKGMPFEDDPQGYLEEQLSDLQWAAQVFRGNKEQLEANAAIEAADHIDYAIEHFDELVPLAEQAKKQMDAQYLRDVTAGVNVSYEDWYVPQRHDIELFTSSSGPIVLGHSKGGGASTQFKKAKVFPDYSSAIQAGFVPRTLSIADLVENRVYQGEKVVQRKAFFDQMRDMKDPVDGKPLAINIPKRIIHRPDGTTDVQESVPLGYSRFEVMPGISLAVHSGYSRLIDALTSSSQIAESAAVGTLQDIAAVEKHIGLALDSFHASRVLQRAATIMHKVVLGDTLNQGKALVEFQPDDLPLAVKNGLITQAMADWASKPRTITVNGQPITESRIDTVQFGVKNGLNAGRVADVIYHQWLNDMPVVGQVQRWVFDKMTRSAVTQSYLVEFERVAKANPAMTAQEVARKVAGDLNVLFGNLQKETLFKNPSFRSINQILFLAPQWVEALARGEMRGAKQIGQTAYEAATGKGFRMGTAGKSLGTGLAAYFIGTQILNLATRHQLTFQNKEKGHKLDAWIPDVSGKTPGFFISPLSVFAEITHDVLRYSREKPSVADAATEIAANKLGNLGRSLLVLGTGRDPVTNEKLIGTANRAVKAATQLIPVPITLSQTSKAIGAAVVPETVQPPRPGSIQRQLTSSLGFKTEPARTAVQQMSERAHDWESKSTNPKIKEAFERRQKETFAPSAYAPLRDALATGDMQAAKSAYNKLEETRTAKQIDTTMAQSVDKPFTESKDSEKAFIESLDEEGKAAYRAAIREREETYRKWMKFKGQ